MVKLINVTSRRNRFFPLTIAIWRVFDDRFLARRFWIEGHKETDDAWHENILYRVEYVVWKYNFVLDIDWTETLYLGAVEIRAACESCVSAVTLWLSSFYKLWKGNSSEAGMIPGWPTISYCYSRNAITLHRNSGKYRRVLFRSSR